MKKFSFITRYTPIQVLLAALFLSSFPGPTFAEIRTWKDNTGRAIQAEFVRATDTAVFLRMNGREYELPLDRLSAEDRAFVKQQSTPDAPASPTAQLPASDVGLLNIGGVDLKPGARVEFTLPIEAALADEIQKEASKLEEPDKSLIMKEVLVGLAIPTNFDPAKTWPILIVNVTASGKEPSSLRAMGGFVKSCTDNGWLCLATDLPGSKAPGPIPYRCALNSAALDALAAKWPASKDWPVATGGFSGGAKYSGWVGGYLSKAGRRVIGMFMGGCNDDAASLALDQFKPKRGEFTRARVFLSSGSADKIASPADHDRVAKSLKDSGFDQVRVETYDGEHKLNQQHLPVALKWFMEVSGK